MIVLLLDPFSHPDSQTEWPSLACFNFAILEKVIFYCNALK